METLVSSLCMCGESARNNTLVTPLQHSQIMKTFKQLLQQRIEPETRPHSYQGANPKLPSPVWIRLGSGMLMACGLKKEQAYKGWITTTENIPKGTKIHCNLYDKPNGVSITLATPKNKNK